MTGVGYGGGEAAAFRATRHIDDEGLTAWRAAVSRHLDPRPGYRLLDLGSGTGMWASAFIRWYDGIEMVAVEPSAAMRARSTYPDVLPGEAGDIPLADDSVDAAWLSTVIHHIPNLTDAALEIRRVVRPGGPVLIRSAFPGRHEEITVFRYFPEAVKILDTFPTVRDVEAAFGAAGFGITHIERIPQVTAPSLRAAATGLRREAHTQLRLLTDDEYAAGLARLRAAAETESGPVIDVLDLLVLRPQGS
jgi:SAM-dependent methyltransferase